MLYPHTPTVFVTVSRTDTDGNTVHWASDKGVPVPAFIQPRTSTVPVLDAKSGGPSQQGNLEAVAYLSSFCPYIDRFSALNWDGWRWALLADPLDQRNPDGSLRMFRAEIRRDRKLAAVEPGHGQ
ncbi:MAG: hypothetical protein ACRD0P_00350 [Stackebrandtia sp.]